MTSPKKMKASDRQAVIRKVMALLQKKYGRERPRDHRDVLSTLLFAIALENTSCAAAEAALARLLEAFHDLNEIRVSSISELEALLSDLPAPEWKALRIREVLQSTFEKYYSFDLDVLKRKTMDVAEKHLAKIDYLTPFARSYVLQHCLGSHVVPVDDLTREVVQWLGLAPAGRDNEATAEELKGAVRKQDAPVLCHLLRRLATDPRYAGTFSLPVASSNGEVDGGTAVERLKQHLARPPRKARPPVKKSRKRPPTGNRRSKTRRMTAGRTVRKRVSKPGSSGAGRRVRSR